MSGKKSLVIRRYSENPTVETWCLWVLRESHRRTEECREEEVQEPQATPPVPHSTSEVHRPKDALPEAQLLGPFSKILSEPKIVEINWLGYCT